MKISLVLLTLNGGKLFEASLRGVIEQQIEAPFEVLVVDSGSVDGTAQVGTPTGTLLLQRKLVRQERSLDEDSVSRDSLWEDQAWASDVQRAGLATGFCEAAAVLHSHDYGPVTLLGRRYDEARFMQRHFGQPVIASWAEAARTARAHAAYFRAHLAQRHPGQGMRWPAYSTRRCARCRPRNWVRKPARLNS